MTLNEIGFRGGCLTDLTILSSKFITDTYGLAMGSLSKAYDSVFLPIVCVVSLGGTLYELSDT
jgi:hypothetical protein